MPQLAVAAAGAALGAATLGTGVVALGLTGTGIGWFAGSLLGSVLFAPKTKAQMADLRVPKIQLGAAMPRIYGTVRAPLNPRWQSEWRVSENSAGGKGGGGSEYYTYSCDGLFWISSIAGMPEDLWVKGWSRLWWNGELVATRLIESGVESIAVNGGGKWSAITFFDGNPAQLPFSVLETALGAENADAHRRVSCIGLEGIDTGTWSNLPALEAEVYTSGTVDDLSDAIPLIVDDWELVGTAAGDAPRHKTGTTRYDALRLYSSNGTVEAAVDGEFDSLDEAMAAAADALGVANAYIIAWSHSANELPSVFDGGADLADDPQYVYLYVSFQPPIAVLQGSGLPGGQPYTRVFFGNTILPELPENYETSPKPMLNRDSWAAPVGGVGFQGVGVTRLVYSTAVYEAPSGYDSIYQATEYPPSSPLVDPGPPPAGYFPTAVGASAVRIRLLRVPFIPDEEYEETVGTYRQLTEVNYSGGVLVDNGVGPVRELGHAEYDDEAFWTAASADAGIPGYYGIDFPVDVTTVGVKTVEAVQLGTVDLADIVSCECLLSGLTAADIDVTELEGIPVRGFIAQGAARDAIEDLMAMFHFYAVCSDKLYFRLLDAAAVLSIPHNMTGAGVNEASEPFTGLERGNDLEVPSEVTLVSPNPSADYDAGAETSDRLVTAGRKRESVNSAVVLSPAERKGRANAFALDARVAMHTGRLSVDDNYAAIEPGDVFTATDDEGNSYTLRAVRETYADGVHDLEVRLFDRNALTLEGVTSDTYSPVITIAQATDTEMVLLDTGLLRDEDDGLHLIAALAPAEAGRWGGASVYRSVDDSTYSAIASTVNRAVFGTATTALAGFSGWTWDETSTVTVNVGSATLSSSTTAAMQADASINVAAIGVDGRWEVFRYRTATLVSPGVYTLSGLLRGLFGTDPNRDSHLVGDTFVRLNTAALRVAVPLADLGLDRYWRAVTARQQVSAADTQPLSPNGVALKPWAPVNLVVDRAGSPTEVTLSWHGRSRLSIRLGGPGGTFVQPDATLTGYRVRIYSSASFASVLRTEDVTDPEFVYTAADQVADGLTPGAQLHVRITQLSSVVGEGYPLQETA